MIAEKGTLTTKGTLTVRIMISILITVLVYYLLWRPEPVDGEVFVFNVILERRSRNYKLSINFIYSQDIL